MRLNNLYNFKNPVKHFLCIDNLILPNNLSTFDLNWLTWTQPINFRVHKENDKFRTLKMPNILNFVVANEHYKDMPNINDIQGMDRTHKRLSANIETGDFVSGEFDRQLEEDFNLLCIYDNLIQLDIKEYYGRIYTHYIDFNGHQERYLSNMNAGATNGVLMGNYLSLYFAEKNLASISNDIQQKLDETNISCEFTYFSDDFYFYCNKKDNEKVIHIFDEVLEQYELERNEKKKIWDYETFNNRNIVARYWKKLMAHCNVRYNSDSNMNKLYFINQIVYRISKLEDDKLKKVFINNFFKTKFFRNISLEKYQVKKYDYHQLAFIMKYSPECMLYISDKFAEKDDFDNTKLEKFFDVRYKESLLSPFNDEQLYYFYAISIFDIGQVLSKYKDLVAKSKNQLLIAYYLKDGLFDQEQIDYLKTLDSEVNWFQNYHLILYTPELLADLENSIEKYLIPKKVIMTVCTKQIEKDKRNTYMNFYKQNLQANKAIISNIDKVKEEIIDYLDLKIAECEEKYQEMIAEDGELGIENHEAHISGLDQEIDLELFD